MNYVRRIITGLTKLMAIYPIYEDWPIFSKIYRYLIVVWLVSIAVVPSTSIFLYRQPDDVFLTITTTAYSIDVLQTFLCWCLYVSKLDTVKEFLENFDKFYLEHDVNTEKRVSIVVYDESKYRKTFVKVAAFVCVSYAFALTAPILQIFRGKEKTLDMIMFPLIVPGLDNTAGTYLLLYILESLLETVVLVNHCLTITHVLFATIWFNDQYRATVRSLTDLDRHVPGDRYGELMSSYVPGYEPSTYGDRLKVAIRRYTDLKRNFSSFKSWYDLFFGIKLAQCIISFCLAMLCLFLVKDPLEYSSLFAYAIFMAVLFYLWCYIGEEFQQMSSNLSKALYNTKWYEQPNGNMKIIVIWMGIVNRHFAFHGFWVYKAGFLVYSNICRTSYSMFNVLHTVLKK